MCYCTFILSCCSRLTAVIGVVQQTIKDQNQSLLDDFLILNDKIGSSVFFWSFPSQRANELNIKKKETLHLLEQLEARIAHQTAVRDELRLQLSCTNVVEQDRKRKRLEELVQEEALLDTSIQVGRGRG